MGVSNRDPGDIDARLQFLLTSTESLHASCQQLHATSANHAAELAELRKTSTEISKQTAGLVTATAALLLISKSHRERLDDLDGGNKQ